MSKFSKYVVLAAGLIGIIAFFLPLIAVKDSGMTGKLSAFQIVKGISKAQDVVGDAGKEADKAGLATKGAVKDANAALGAVKGIVLAVFAPALLLLVFGGVGTLRQSFGRALGISSLIFGLIGLGIWALLNAAASEAGGGDSVAGIGLHLLLVTGLGGVVGGLMATIKPERRAARPDLVPNLG